MVVTANGDDVEIDADATIADLLDQLGLGAKWVLVERNGEPVERADIPTTVMIAGDRIELVRAVAGG